MKESPSFNLAKAIAIGGGCALSAYLTARWLGNNVRIGSRRNPIPMTVSEDDNFLIKERDCSLLQQWYSDQPVQRIYGLACTASMTQNLIPRLYDRSNGEYQPSLDVCQALWSVICRHPILSSTIVRDPTSQRATTRCCLPKQSVYAQSVTHPMGNLPLQILPRANNASWQEIAKAMTYQQLREDGWLFRVAIIVPEETNKDIVDSEIHIVLIMHHFITDGLSSVILMQDFLSYISHSFLKSSLPLSSLIIPSLQLPILQDELMDLRPTLSIFVKALFSELLPVSWRPQPPYFWQGEPYDMPSAQKRANKHPQFVNTVIPRTHMATITLPASYLQGLSQFAKYWHVSMHSLLSTMALAVTASLPETSESVAAMTPVKFVYPIGKGARALCNWPTSTCSVNSPTTSDVTGNASNTVGTFITSTEAIFQVPTSTLSMASSSTSWSRTHSVQPFLDLLQEVSGYVTQPNIAEDSLSFMGLLDFLPRNSWKDWFINEGLPFYRGHKTSLEVSNLGVVERFLPDVVHHEFMFSSNDEHDTIEEELRREKEKHAVHFKSMYLLLGTGYALPVIDVGVVAVRDTSLTLTIGCHVGADGCGCILTESNNDDSNKVINKQQCIPKGMKDDVCVYCTCVKQGRLDKFTTRFVELAKTLSSDRTLPALKR